MQHRGEVGGPGRQGEGGVGCGQVFLFNVFWVGGAPKRHRGVDITPGSAFGSLMANKAAGEKHIHTNVFSIHGWNIKLLINKYCQ